MKKTGFLFLGLMLMLAGTVNVWADGLDDYYDYKNADGTYSYYFDQGITITMSEEWYQNTFVKANGPAATFYHKDSYKKYQEEGFEGGRLFTIAYSVNQDFKDLPSFSYLGFDEGEMLNYYVEFPTDAQAYMKDESIGKEYERLYSTVEEVIDSIEIIGADDEDDWDDDFDVDDYDDDDEDDDFDLEDAGLTGGWAITEDASVPEDVLALFEEATGELTEAEYEPVALLGTQVVAGTNYCILCRVTPVDPDEQPGYALGYIYRDPEDNAALLGFIEIEIGDMDA